MPVFYELDDNDKGKDYMLCDKKVLLEFMELIRDSLTDLKLRLERRDEIITELEEYLKLSSTDGKSIRQELRQNLRDKIATLKLSEVKNDNSNPLP